MNDDKSQLESSTNFTFLGFIIDSLNMKLYLPQDKIDKTVSGRENTCFYIMNKSHDKIKTNDMDFNQNKV